MKIFNFQFSIFKKNFGYLLIELMVAISVFVIGVLGFLGLLSTTLSLNRDIADKFTANYLASEGIEIAKNLIDANILDGSPWNNGAGGLFIGRRCFVVDYNSLDNSQTINRCNFRAMGPLKYATSTGYTYSSGQDTPFYRYIEILPVRGIGTNNAVKINSTVFWRGHGNSQNQIILEDYFFNPLP